MAPGVSKQVVDPPWLSPLRQALVKRDARWLVVYNAYRVHFHGAATAAQLARYLAEQGYAWAPAARTVQRWMNVILPLEGQFKAGNKR